jgi:hypothetical protein
MGAWYLWALLGGLLLMVGFGPWFHDMWQKKKAFDAYMAAESKAILMKNMEEVEELAYFLGRPAIRRLEQKKRELKIKKK